MKRLMIFPVLFIAGAAWAWTTGMAWPIATTVVRPFLRPDPCNEGDYMA